ncbi:50S ribosomal protein L30 [Candidatus Woesearchaeota archaeon]|nr:50S ribosomal protein L30 [Candidatus Woesearchaeota archaeon]
MKLAIIQIRGILDAPPKVRATFNLLKLPKSHSCVLADHTPVIHGMLAVLKDYVTWGEIDLSTLQELLVKRGKLPSGNALTDSYVQDKLKMSIASFAQELFNSRKKIKDVPGLKPYFRLKPPVHGFERGGVKKPFSIGGVLGYRGAKINDLLRRML